MSLALTVDVGWPWWAVTAIASSVAVAGLAAFLIRRAPAGRAVGGLLALEGVVIAIVAPFVMSDMNRATISAARSATMTSRSSGYVIHVIEHAPPANMRKRGVVLTFANPIFDGRNSRRIGRDQGFCVTIHLAPADECTWTTVLPGGQITAEGPLSDTQTTVVAITGGTGRYEQARGWAQEKVHDKAGTEFDVYFHVRS